MKELPFKTCFAELVIKPMVSEERDKCLALASLAEVSKFIPNIDTTKNVDLLPVAFNACVVNRVNKNSDVIDTQTAIAMYKNFAFKPINVEHQRQKVIGLILTAGFSEFGSDKPLTEEQVKTMTGPFNITLGGVVWRMVVPELADLIEESGDPSSPKHLSVSASWELGFTGYRIALMEGGKKNLAEASRIITDPKEVEAAQNKLVALGGDGKFEDLFAYRMPTYDVLPLGIGFTEKPAAEVKGIASKQAEKVGQKEDPAVGKPPQKDPVNPVPVPQGTDTDKVGIRIDPAVGEPPAKAGETNELEKTNKISQTDNSNVNKERIQDITMAKINTLADLTDESLKTCTASVITDFISSELKKGSDTWAAEKNTLNDQIAKANAVAVKAKEDYEAIQKQMKEVQATLDKLNTEKVEREKVEAFNSRMATVASEYDLDDDLRAAVASELKELASEEAWTKWQSKAKVLLKGYAKKNDKAKDGKKNDGDDDDKAKAAKDKKAKADDMDDDSEAAKKAKAAKEAAAAAAVDKALENADKDAGLPNGAPAGQKSLKETYASAFAFTKENFVITR